MRRVAVLLAVLVVSGCGAGTTAQVAALPSDSGTGSASGSASGSAAGSAAPSAADTTRPQLRVDDTMERRVTLFRAYGECLVEHGATQVDVGPIPSGKPTLIYIASPTPAAAQSACEHLLALPPPELEASTNPHFHEDEVAYVACMKRRGLYVTLLNDHNPDWTFADGHSVPDDANLIEQRCMRQTFGGAE